MANQSGCIGTSKFNWLNSNLKFDHEEADKRILFDISHAIQSESYRKIILATDIFTRKLYPHQQWIHEDLQELQMLYGQGVSSRILPIHQIADTLESDVNSILPAVHV